MPSDYIHAPDAEFDSWLDNFVRYANANLAALGLVAADMDPVNAIHYMFRWVNSSTLKGPWSQTVSVTIEG